MHAKGQDARDSSRRPGRLPQSGQQKLQDTDDCYIVVPWSVPRTPLSLQTQSKPDLFQKAAFTKTTGFWTQKASWCNMHKLSQLSVHVCMNHLSCSTHSCKSASDPSTALPIINTNSPSSLPSVPISVMSLLWAHLLLWGIHHLCMITLEVNARNLHLICKRIDTIDS